MEVGYISIFVSCKHNFKKIQTISHFEYYLTAMNMASSGPIVGLPTPQVPRVTIFLPTTWKWKKLDRGGGARSGGIYIKLLEAYPPLASNVLHCHAVFYEMWQNSRLAPLLALAHPLVNFGSAADVCLWIPLDPPINVFISSFFWCSRTAQAGYSAGGTRRPGTIWSPGAVELPSTRATPTRYTTASDSPVCLNI